MKKDKTICTLLQRADTSFNQTTHNILKNKIDLILPQFHTIRKEKRGIITSLILSFISLVYESISSFLHNRRHKALHETVEATETKVDIQHNRLIHLEDSVAMYGVYNTETLKKFIKTVNQIHNTITSNEKLFAGELSTAFTWYVKKKGIPHYAINALLYLRTLREKYVKMYKFSYCNCIYMLQLYKL